MSIPDWRKGSYSAVVDMHLTVNGRMLDVAQLAPDFIVLRDAATCEPGPAEMFLKIDESEYRRPVYLDEGIDPARVKTPMSTTALSEHVRPTAAA